MKASARISMHDTSLSGLESAVRIPKVFNVHPTSPDESRPSSRSCKGETLTQPPTYRKQWWQRQSPSSYGTTSHTCAVPSGFGDPEIEKEMAINGHGGSRMFDKDQVHGANSERTCTTIVDDRWSFINIRFRWDAPETEWIGLAICAQQNSSRRRSGICGLAIQARAYFFICVRMIHLSR